MVLMRDKVTTKIKNNVNTLLLKLGIEDEIVWNESFDNFMALKTIQFHLKISDTDNATFYKLNDNITFIIPDKLSSCYQGSPYTIYLLMIEGVRLISRDTEKWVGTGIGQIDLNESLSINQEHIISNLYNNNSDRHRITLVKIYEQQRI